MWLTMKAFLVDNLGLLMSLYAQGHLLRYQRFANHQVGPQDSVGVERHLEIVDHAIKQCLCGLPFRTIYLKL